MCVHAFTDNLLLQFNEYLDLHSIQVKPNYYNSTTYEYLHSVGK